jgi:hypothetical protein
MLRVSLKTRTTRPIPVDGIGRLFAKLGNGPLVLDQPR